MDNSLLSDHLSTTALKVSNFQPITDHFIQSVSPDQTTAQLQCVRYMWVKEISNILLHSVRISASLGNRACSSPNLNIASMLVFQFSLDYRCIHLHHMNILSVQPPLSFWSSSPSLWSYSHSEANQSTNSSTSALYSSSCPSLMHPTMQTRSCTESLAMTKCIHLFSSNFGRFVLWHAGQRRT